MNGSLLDLCLLEWCKLFTDLRGKQFWKRIVDDPDAFKDGLFKEISVNEDDWTKYLRKVKRYRDKFVAHLDSDKFMNLPDLDIAFKSIEYYFRYLGDLPEGNEVLAGFPSDLALYYEQCLREGRKEYYLNLTQPY